MIGGLWITNKSPFMKMQRRIQPTGQVYKEEVHTTNGFEYAEAEVNRGEKRLRPMTPR